MCPASPAKVLLIEGVTGFRSFWTPEHIRTMAGVACFMLFGNLLHLLTHLMVHLQTPFAGDRELRLSQEQSHRTLLAESHEHCSSGEEPLNRSDVRRPDASTICSRKHTTNPNCRWAGRHCWTTASLQHMRDVLKLAETQRPCPSLLGFGAACWWPCS